jgi:hypothetical protein
MTRDELKSKLLISDETKIYETLRIFQAALYEVLELHKSIPPEEGFESMHITYCQGCSIVEIVDWATCPTIQAIEKVFE